MHFPIMKPTLAITTYTTITTDNTHTIIVKYMGEAEAAKLKSKKKRDRRRITGRK